MMELSLEWSLVDLLVGQKVDLLAVLLADQWADLSVAWWVGLLVDELVDPLAVLLGDRLVVM